MSRASVVVVGAGISGLSAAWALSGGSVGPDESTPRVELIESRDRVGGALATTTFAGRTIDLGPDGFLARRPEAINLVDELGLSERLEAVAARGASLYAHGALHPLPGELHLGVPTTLASLRGYRGLSWRARVAARRDYYAPRRFKPHDDETIGAITRTKLGREITYQLIEPLIGGIQAGRVDELSSASVFPALLAAARDGGSLMRALGRQRLASPGPKSEQPSAGPLFCSLVDGVGSLPLVLAQQLEARGVIVRRGVAATALRRTPAGSYPWEVDTLATTTPADAVILATPALVTGSLLGALHPNLDALRTIPSAGNAMLTVSIAREAVTLPDGTGVLVPLGTSWHGEGSLMTTAVTFLDRKWPRLRRDDDVLLRAHVGRSDDERWAAMSDDELTGRVLDELATIFTSFGDVRETLVQRWPGGLPQYRVGHELLVKRARAAAASLDVALAGNAFDGVGVPASIGSGRRAASEVLTSLLRS